MSPSIASPATGEGRAAGESLGAATVPERRTMEAVRALTRASRAMERAAGGLSLAHYRVLSTVAAGDERASRVAARLALGKPTVSASVEALSARGLLAREAVEGDQRAVRLSLTPAGKELLAGVEAAMTANLESLADATGRPDDVIDILVALGSVLERGPAERHR